MQRMKCMVGCALALVAGSASANEYALRRSGELYRALTRDEGLVVVHRTPDGQEHELLAPETAQLNLSSLELVVSDSTGDAYVVWQRDEEGYSVVELAGIVGGAWFGPVHIAGDGGSSARNPQVLLDAVVETVDDPEAGENEPSTLELTAVFLHVVWWQDSPTGDVGRAYYVPVRLSESGLPEEVPATPVALSDLLPYNIGCSGLDQTENLTHPLVFSDVQSGYPHILAADLSECLFQILRLGYEVIEEPDTKRRRVITVWNTEAVVGVNASTDLSKASVEVGRGLSVVVYWDAEGAVNYTRLVPDEATEIRSLGLSEELSRDEAVALIRGLVN